MSESRSLEQIAAIQQAELGVADAFRGQLRLSYERFLQHQGIAVPDSKWRRPASDDPAVQARYDQWQGVLHTYGAIAHAIDVRADRARQRATQDTTPALDPAEQRLARLLQFLAESPSCGSDHWGPCDPQDLQSTDIYGLCPHAEARALLDEAAQH